MKESILKSLMRLFAIVSQVHSVEEISGSKAVVEEYLKLVVRKDKIRQYLIMYDFYHNNLREREIRTGNKQLSLFSVKAVIICEQINSELDKQQKLFILTHLIEILAVSNDRTVENNDFVKTMAVALKIEEKLFDDCLSFIFNDLGQVNDKQYVLVVDSDVPSENYKHLFREFLGGKIIFLYVPHADVCLFRHVQKDDLLYYNEEKIDLDTTYIFDEGSQIKSPLLGTLFYNDVLKVFLHEANSDKVYFVADSVSYRFPNSNAGLMPFTFSEQSGELIGIMGNSGVGKSTMLNLLNGNLKPNSGRILINGYNIHEQPEEVQGIIGFIPQDDMLIEELTVYQNLYYSARLCFKKLSVAEVKCKVEAILNDLGLFQAKDLKVGNPLNKFISGGQRKRLNIALELIREPNILFVDEPTSGLSSRDSDLVVDLLKRQSLKGKLIVINIHQPSSDIFKKFDKLLLIDNGGRVVYQGNPLNSLVYLKTFMQFVNADEGECSNCGNINPEQVLQIIETKNVDDFGNYTSERKISAEAWYKNYQKNQEKQLSKAVELKIDLPKSEFEPLSKFNQFRIFGIRNLLSKLTNKQYLLINLLEAPVLAFILGWFTRYNAGTVDNPTEFVFSLNSNMPVYIFMSVVVAIFLGLMVSAEEIIRDSTVLKREEFLHLNRKSYFNSKVFYLASVLAFQMFLFVLVGNTILEIKEMYFSYWLMLWVTSLVAGILGLNLSATLKSVVAIYILIPLLVVPQILLGGAMIPFNKLNSKLTTPVQVPLSGNIIPSRWAYEALAVYQFKNNKYQRQLYGLEQEVSVASFRQNYLIPEISGILADVKYEITQNSSDLIISQKLDQLMNGITRLSELAPNCSNNIEKDDLESFNISVFREVDRFISCTKEYFNKELDLAIEARDNKIYNIEKRLGGIDKLVKLKKLHSNDKLVELLTNQAEPNKVILYDNKIVQLTDPIYLNPVSKIGRAHFFAPVKRIGNYYLDTYWYNILMLLVFLVFFYLTLIFNLMPKFAMALSQRRLKWIVKQFRLRILNIFKPVIR